MNLELPYVKLKSEDNPLLSAIREQGRHQFKISGIPTAKTEAWKYTKPNRFLSSEFSYDTNSSTSALPVFYELPFDCYKICFENGIFNSEFSVLPDEIEVLPVTEAITLYPDIASKIGTVATAKEFPFVALNNAYLNEGFFIHIPQGCKLSKPLAFISHITGVNEADLAVKPMYNLRNIIFAEENSFADIVEYYHYFGVVKSSYFVNVVNEIFVSSGATLNHYKYQDEAFKSAHIALSAVDVKSNGFYNSFCMQKGADLSRNETKVCLSEEHASAQVNACYKIDGWATQDITTNIEHLKPLTKSLQLVKGVVDGHAKGVFQGRITMHPNAIKTYGDQLHKALLLSSDAEVDVKPELKIYADDVKSSHGAASGYLDPEQLFYMQSRGISLEQAKRILIDAYLNEVISKVQNTEIRQWFQHIIQPDCDL